MGKILIPQWSLNPRNKESIKMVVDRINYDGIRFLEEGSKDWSDYYLWIIYSTAQTKMHDIHRRADRTYKGIDSWAR